MFARATIPIGGLLDGYEVVLTEMGYSFSTKLKYLKYASIIIQRHQNNGLECLDLGISDTDYRELLSFTVNREKRVYPALPKADIAKLLARYFYTGSHEATISDEIFVAVQQEKLSRVKEPKNHVVTRLIL